MSEIVVPLRAQRDIKTVTAEVQTLKRQAQGMLLHYAIEIGRCLQEAKSMVPFGEWGNYLQTELDYSQSTANNLMRIAEEYGKQQVDLFSPKSQALENLTYTKALSLLALPEQERAEFAETHDVEHMSTRELEKAIRERDAAKRKAEEAEQRLENITAERDRARADCEAADKQATEAEARLRREAEKAKNVVKSYTEEARRQKEAAVRAEAAAKEAKDKLKKLKENPHLPETVLQKMRQEAEAQAKEAAASEAEKAVREANEKAAQAERALQEANAKLEAAKKEQQLSNPDVAVFRTLFATIQEDLNKLKGALLKVQANDEITAEKLRRAMVTVLEAAGKEFGA